MTKTKLKPSRAKLGKPVDMAKLLTPTSCRMVVSKPRGVGRSAETKTAAGIVLPEQNEWTRKEYGQISKVVSVGPDVTDFKPGDTVLVTQFAGVPVYRDSRETISWIISADDVLAKVADSYWDTVPQYGTT